MKRIMVTGGAGFLGTNLTLSLTQNSKNFINIIDNLSTSSAINIKNIKSNNINFIENDICSPINVDDSLDEIYHLVHLSYDSISEKSVKNPFYFIFRDKMF